MSTLPQATADCSATYTGQATKKHKFMLLMYTVHVIYVHKNMGACYNLVNFICTQSLSGTKLPVWETKNVQTKCDTV